MDFLLLVLLYIGLCILVWKILSAKARRAKASTDRALWKAVAVSLVFSPGLLVGHGALPGPAILGLLSGEVVVNGISLFLVFIVSLLVLENVYRRQDASK